MKRKWGKLVAVIFIATSIIFMCANSYAHSGRTDANGGHKDNKNKSGLGYYHYHCGGHPAHLHKNGVCPYSKSSFSYNKSSKSSSSSKKSSSSTKSTSTSSSNTKTKSSTSSKVSAASIKINESVVSMNMGESENLTATITPDNTTDKKVTWKSSDESIATVSSTGKITAKKSGMVTITATTSNGKKVSRKIEITGIENVENSIANTSLINKDENNSNIMSTNTEESNSGGVLVALGLLGGGSYLGYKKYKSKNNEEVTR